MHGELSDPRQIWTSNEGLSLKIPFVDVNEFSLILIGVCDPQNKLI